MYAFSAPLLHSPLRTSSATLTHSYVPSSRPPIARARRVRWTANVQPPPTDTDYDALGKEWVDSGLAKYPVKIIEHAFKTFPGEVAIAFSGAEDVVLIEYASRTKLPFRVFALDTGRLHPETYRFYAEVERHYDIRIEYTFPDGKEVMDFVNEKGLFSFYQDGHQECCRIRKVRPLRKKLGTLSAWVTGQRKDQSPGTRSEIPVVQVDPAFRGSGDKPLIKYNPLANISSSDVWATIRATGVPYNALHMEGFISIGCEPCTRAVLPNQHEREGRWWWEEATQKECGLHKGNMSPDAASAELADDFVEESIAKDDVVFFTKRGCPYCKAMKDLFIELGVPHAEYAISEREDYGDIVAALERRTGQTTAPNLFIAGEHIGGNKQTRILHKTGELLPLLEAAGVSTMVQA